MVYADNLTEQLLDAADVPRGLPLVAALTGFMDTGAAVVQLTGHFASHLEMRPVLVFDLDEFYDYRARRPIITFDQDHLTEYEPPRLEISLVSDELGAQFLFLHGVEPDFRWQGFCRAIEAVVAQFEVRSFVWMHSIPMPTPHTRPVQATVSGTRADLVERFSVWRPRTQVPSNVLHLLEFRLSALGLETVGFVLLVPHYLGENNYPDAALKAVECISAATGLILPTDELREEARVFARRLAEQMSDNEELQALVSGLEQRHDSFMAGADIQLPVDDAFEVPDGEQIAAEWEQFLANRPQSDGPDAS